jgi:hypothetical protein
MYERIKANVIHARHPNKLNAIMYAHKKAQWPRITLGAKTDNNCVLILHTIQLNLLDNPCSVLSPLKPTLQDTRLKA